MEVTLEGMVMDWMDSHLRKARSIIDVTPELIVTDWRDLHS